MKWPAFMERRFLGPMRSVLKTGITPGRLSLSIATGTIVGIFPVLGTTTMLCFVLSFALRLNVVAMQAFNWLVAGMQLLLILPFIRLGEKLFGAAPLALRTEEIEALFREGFLHALSTLGMSLVHAVAGWLVIAPLLFGTVYFAAHAALKRRVRRTEALPAS